MSFLSNYAHLLGLKPKGARAEDEDDEKAKKAKGRRAEDDDENDPDAEDDDNDPDAEEDDENDPDAEEDDDDDKPAGRKAKGKKAEDDDEADAKVAKGRAIERKRIAAIFGCKAAGVRPDMAASLAFNTSLSASQAVAQLKQAAAFGAPALGGRMSLDERMRSTQKHHVGQDAQQQASTGTAGKINEMTNLYNAINGGK